jgi:thiamine biosynthesis lipoprotein
MSTFVTVTVEDRSEGRAQEAIGRAFEELQRLTALLTRFDAGSPLGVLNATGRLADPPPELSAVVARGLEIHEASAGAFDPTVAPLVDLLELHFAAHGGPPNEAEVRDVREIVGAHRLRLGEGGLRFGRAGMALTLDGIAKGYIVDRLVEAVAARGIRHALVNAGGDVRALGARADGRPWRVAVQDPLCPAVHAEVVSLTDAAIATSGDYVRFHDAERRYHHTVVPGTGRSPEAIASVSVRAPTAMEADALATVVFVLGDRAGGRLVEARGASCLVLTREGGRLASPGW